MDAKAHPQPQGQPPNTFAWGGSQALRCVSSDLTHRFRGHRIVRRPRSSPGSTRSGPSTTRRGDALQPRLGCRDRGGRRPDTATRARPQRANRPHLTNQPRPVHPSGQNPIAPNGSPRPSLSEVRPSAQTSSPRRWNLTGGLALHAASRIANRDCEPRTGAAEEIGVAYGSRTRNLRIHIPMLCRLS